MSDMPWVRFFPSDWLAGTRGMSAAETGIYITLVATMYERGEPIPEDHSRLARLCGAPVATFRKTLETLIDEGKISRLDTGLWNKRVGEESEYRLEKSEAAANAASARWSKKTNKNNGASDATALQTQSAGNAIQKPDTRDHIAASQPRSAGDYQAITDKLLDAAGLSGFRAERAPALMNIAPVLGLLDADFDLDREILAAVRAKTATGFVFKSWKLLPDIVQEFAEKRRGAASTPRQASKPVDWQARVTAFNEQGIWPHSWGPKPGESGCGAPAELIQQARAA